MLSIGDVAAQSGVPASTLRYWEEIGLLPAPERVAGRRRYPNSILRRLNSMLADRFHISHTTVQFEHVSCAISENGCAIPVQIYDAEGHHHHH